MFRTRKWKIATNVLGVYDTKGDFVYVLVGWEGSLTDSQILHDALARQNGLQVLKGIYNFLSNHDVLYLHIKARKALVFVTIYYYLCDASYPNAEVFLAPYRGQQYHLQEWRGAGNAPTIAKEYLNMTHSSARNVIEHAFGVLKDRWAILHGKLYCLL
ncbi:hypothetical protein IC582_023858 [Cucumis melo]